MKFYSMCYVEKVLDVVGYIGEEFNLYLREGWELGRFLEEVMFK